VTPKDTLKGATKTYIIRAIKTRTFHKLKIKEFGVIKGILEKLELYFRHQFFDLLFQVYSFAELLYVTSLIHIKCLLFTLSKD
jgi:hypothetical protein